MSAATEAAAFAARIRVTEAAMALARIGLNREEIVEIMTEVAVDGANKAADWAEAYDRKQAAADDREDFAAEFARDAEREYGT